MSLEIGLSQPNINKGNSPKADKDSKSLKSGQLRSLTNQLHFAATEGRRASVQSLHSIASSIQSMFFPVQQNGGSNAGTSLNEEKMRRLSFSTQQPSDSSSPTGFSGLTTSAGPVPSSPGSSSVAGPSNSALGSSGELKSKLSAAQVEFRALPVVARTSSVTKIPKNESLKIQKKYYRHEKRRAAEELLSTLKDPSIVILADWLKVRSSLKTWMKLCCVLKPGLIVLYKSNKPKFSHWVGTILLGSCEILERPSKKDGFCFKVFHPLDQSIWATKGPKGENIGAITQPLPYSYLIFRALSEAAGKCWMDALELALRCSSLLIRTMTKETKSEAPDDASAAVVKGNGCRDASTADENDADFHRGLPLEMNDSDCERHFYSCGMDEDSKTDREDKDEGKSDMESEDEEEGDKFYLDDNQPPAETIYIENSGEELGQQGDASQTEEVADENKSLIWSLVRQVRPGMDLSKVVLPTFILEPRSFLDKLSDYYYHVDHLSEAVREEDPFTRFKLVVRWYLSGFYKKPKGIKKPYNPILGETFRCCWIHPQTKSRTFYIAEQVSHHPPVSAFYVTNRHDGYVISGSILAKSKFYGNSLSGILDGLARLTFLKRGEEYSITMPYAHCKGILIGTLTMELGGVVQIHCEKTGYRAEIEFKLKPFLGSGEASNRVAGKIRLGDEVLATISGHWDQEVFIRDKQSGETVLFWNPTNEVKQRRLKRFTVPLESQAEFESEKLWIHTSNAIVQGNQSAATNEKYLLEEEQRKAARERKAKMEDWSPRYFERNLINGEWIYKYADLRPWDPMNDIIQYENIFVIQTKTRHQTPIVHTTSIVNMDKKSKRQHSRSHSRGSSAEGSRAVRMKRLSLKHLCSVSSRGSGSSSSAVPDDSCVRHNSVSSLSGEERIKQSKHMGSSKQNVRVQKIKAIIEPIVKAQGENSEKLTALQNQLFSIQNQLLRENKRASAFSQHEVFAIGILLLFQLLLFLWLQR